MHHGGTEDTGSGILFRISVRSVSLWCGFSTDTLGGQYRAPPRSSGQLRQADAVESSPLDRVGRPDDRRRELLGEPTHGMVVGEAVWVELDDLVLVFLKHRGARLVPEMELLVVACRDQHRPVEVAIVAAADPVVDDQEASLLRCALT